MITDKYLLEEIGTRQEITSSMVTRAEYRRGLDFWAGMVPTTGEKLLEYQMLLQQKNYGVQSSHPGVGGLPDFLGGALGGLFLPNRCPYCGK